jgi:hypothetical protein
MQAARGLARRDDPAQPVDLVALTIGEEEENIRVTGAAFATQPGAPKVVLDAGVTPCPGPGDARILKA